MIKAIDINIWDREFNLQIAYDCYKDETITQEQIDAVKRFVQNKSLIDKAKLEVEKYCNQKLMEDEDNQKKDNVFSYIKPEYLFVKREDKPRVAIMCKYRYDMEHGLAVVFTADEKVSVGLQDIIL